jgi:hypothetical protein
VLVFERCGWWCWPEEGPTLKNERSCLFSRGVGGGAGQRKVQPSKMSGRARFREVWVVVLARGRSNPLKTSATACFRGWVDGGAGQSSY